MNNIKPEWYEKALNAYHTVNTTAEGVLAALEAVANDIAAHAVESAGLALLCDDDAYIETALGGVDYVQEWLHERAETIRSNEWK